jgi:hypothetical protein
MFAPSPFRLCVLALVLAVPALGLQSAPTAGRNSDNPLDFTDAVNLPTGISPYFVVAADLNKDGYLDLAASNTVSHSITVFLNRGNGTFGDGVEYKTNGFTPYALAAGDLDGDGNIDLVCGNMFSVNVSIFYNKGDGTFEDAVLMKADAGPMFTSIADLDGDGRPDLAICNIGHDDVSVFFNRGRRQFEHGDTYPCRGVVPYSIIAADFDGDGDIDLATGNIYSSNISVFENLGHGTFAEARTYKTDSLTQILYAADFNHDGRPDIVTGNGGSDTISVLINDGTGGFLPAVNYRVKLPQGVTAGDIDGDGDIDIATANQSANTTSVLLNRGDGTFQPAIDFQVQGLYPTGVLMADLDRNGKMDLVTANSGSNNLSILYNGVRVPRPVETTPSAAAAVSLVGGKLSQAIHVAFNTGISIASAAAVQLRGSQSGPHDARVSLGASQNALDVESGGTSLRAFFAGEQVTVSIASVLTSKEGLRMKHGYESTFELQPLAGTGHFQKRSSVPGGVVLSAVPADVDGDHRLDLVAVHDGKTVVTVYFSGEGDTLSDRREFQTDLLDPGPVSVVDIDRDGRLDIVVADRLLPVAAILFNQGNRSFAAPTRVSLSPDTTLSRPVALAAGDFNGDGLIDLATVNRLTDDITVTFNRSGRTFSPPGRIATGAKPRLIAAADLDGNGVPDLVTVNTRPDSVSLFMNDGAGKFVKKDDLPLLYGDPRQIVIADLNRDGAVDLVIVDGTSKELVRFQNNGDGTFRRPDYLALPGAAYHVAIGDVNADGAVDLIVGHAGGVTVLRGAPDGSFTAATPSAFVAGTYPIAGDFTGRGAVDLAVANDLTDAKAGITLFANEVRASSLIAPAPQRQLRDR